MKNRPHKVATLDLQVKILFYLDQLKHHNDQSNRNYIHLQNVTTITALEKDESFKQDMFYYGLWELPQQHYDIIQNNYHKGIIQKIRCWNLQPDIKGSLGAKLKQKLCRGLYRKLWFKFEGVKIQNCTIIKKCDLSHKYGHYRYPLNGQNKGLENS